MERVLYRLSIKSFIILVCFLCVTQSALATTVVRPSDVDMIVGARAIVRGKVLSVGSAFDEHGNIYTYTTVRVKEVLKGQISERRIVIKESGGQVGEQGSVVFGTPQFTRGEKVLLYLDTWKDGSLRVHQMFLGKFSIVQDERTGEETAIRSEPDGHVAVLHSNSSDPITDRMELSAYLKMLRGGLIANAERSQQFEETYYGKTPLLPQPPEYRGLSDRGDIHPDFVLINSQHPRWFEPDTGEPVTFMVNPDGAPNGNIMADVTAAMNAWSTVPGCALQVANGGAQSVCAPTFGLNTIIFNACDGRWAPAPGCAGILALGGLGWTGTTKVVNGTTFHQAVAGFVSVNPNALCNFNDPCNVREMLTHEIGHALGLGHSLDAAATMFGIAHFDGRCASLRPDDVNGITFIYPATGGGPGPLTVATSVLAGGTPNTAYNQTLIATGGTQPYSWSLVPGQGTLPPGLSLSASGAITGTPTTNGTSNFTVKVTDNAGATAQKALAITIADAAVPLNSQFISQTVPTSIQPSGVFNVNMKFLNTGTRTWSGGSYFFASQNPPLNTTWGGNGVNLGAFSVGPGQTMDVNFTAQAPPTPGNYNFQWQMYENGGAGFFGQVSTNVVIQVGAPAAPTDGAAFVSQTVPTSMNSGQTYNVSVTMSNTGTSTWAAGTYYLSSQNPLGNNTWGLNRVNLASSVSPNAQAVFTFSVTAPSTPGTYNFQWQMVGAGASLFGTASSNVAVTVSGGSGGSPPIKLTGNPFGTSPAWTPGREFDKASDGNVSTIFDYAFESGGYTGIDLGAAANARRIVKIRFFPRSDWPGGPGRMVGSRFQGSNSSNSSGYVDLFTVSTAPGLNSWVDVTITDQTAYRYLRYLSPEGGYCNIAEIEFYTDTTAPPPPPPPDPGPQPIKVTGTAFGTGPPWAVGREFDKAFDNNTSTIFDYAFANGGYTGLDLGSAANARRIVKIRFFPRSDWPGGPGRMVGGRFQGSNTSNNSGFVDLYTVTAPPSLGNWVEVTVSDLTAYRYLRYLSPDASWGNVAEIEFYTDSSAPPGPTPIKLAGTSFGTNPPWTPGREFDKAFDGNTSTIFDYAFANGAYTGIDLGSANAKKIVKIRFFPRSDFSGGGARMLGGKFQGSNAGSNSGFVDLHVVTSTPALGNWIEVTISDQTAYRYLRYVSPDGGYGNVAEIEFYTDQ